MDNKVDKSLTYLGTFWPGLYGNPPVEVKN